MHKKYTYKDGKRFGPYYYETKRVDGKIVTTYLGSTSPKKNNAFFTLLLFSTFVLLFLSIYFFSFNLTGNATLDLKTNYNFGEQITGNLELSLIEGELIPADSIVLVNYGNFSKEFVLSDLVYEEKIEGNFYAQGTSISGKGYGYGLIGKKIEYPTIDFEISISEDDGNNEKNNNVETELTKSQTNTETENIASESSESAPEQQQETNTESTITGAVVSENTISGQVSKEQEFIYSLSDGQSASILSVTYNGDVLEEDVLDIKIKKDEIVITTDYYVKIEGYGLDYEGSGKNTLSIDISEFGLIADIESPINILLSYDGSEIISVSEDIAIDSKGTEKESKIEKDESEIIPQINQTFGNETAVNETIITNIIETNLTGINQTIINESLTSVNITQFTAVIGHPVKWIKKVSVDVNGNSSLIVELPISAENISVSKVESANEDQENIELAPETIVNEETIENIEESTISITGKVSADFELKKESFFDKLLKLFRFTGRAIDGEIGSEVQQIEVAIDENDIEVEVEYYTGAPTSSEEMISKEIKKVFISSPEDVHYENVLIFTNLSNDFGITESSSIIIEWVENGTNLQTYSVNDSDLDGFIDYIEWIAPHLSNQTFNIIVIINALHLDENRGFISNIYNETRELDGLWSETIQNGHYVRAVFEQNLTNENDITIYPRAANGTSIGEISIEVYEKDSGLLINQFVNITENLYNKIYLINLSGAQDTFDLKIVGGDVEFDHIIDPTAQPGGVKELRAQQCYALRESADTESYTSACTGTYPAACATDLISCDDGSTENVPANLNLYAGINITAFNNSIINCQAITQVSLCYEWWNDLGQGFTTCPIYVDANGGASYSDISIPACPGKTANPGRSCIDVTGLETWTCGNFFGASGTRARAKTLLLNDINDGVITLSHDALFFNVTYTESNPPNVFDLRSPVNGSIRNIRSANLTLVINDSDWINGTAGTITAYVDTDSTFSYENIIYGNANFTTNGTFYINYSIPPLTFNNSQGMFLLYHFDNNTIYGENLTRVVDFATKAFNGTYSNVNGDRERSKDGLGLAYEIDSNERISLTDAALLDSPSVTGEITILAWVNMSINVTTDANQFFSLVSKQGAGTSRDYMLLLNNATSTMAFSTGNGTGSASQVYFVANTKINANLSWYHVAVTYNRADGNTTFYINGVADKSQNLTHNNTLIDTTAVLNIGGNNANDYFPGLVDDLAIYNKTLTAAEILDIYRLREGTYHWRVNVSDNAGAYNSSPIYTFTIGNNIPYNGTVLSINSTTGTNKTWENLNVYTTLLDLDNNAMNVTVRWYRNHTLNLTFEYNSSYANGTTFIATLGHFNTTKNEQWWAGLTLNDGISSLNVNSSNLTILDSAPNVTLLTPENNSISPNFTTQNFTWAMDDADDPEYISAIQINWSSLSAYAGCNDPNFNGSTVYPFLDNRTSYAMSDSGIKFQCPSYLWSVQAQGTVLGDYAPYFRINFTGIEPNITLNAPLNDSTLSPNSISFNWTANDSTIGYPNGLNSSCNLSIDNVINQSNINSPNLTMVNRSISNFSIGTHHWNVTCLDIFGNRGYSFTRTFIANDIPYNGTALAINSTTGTNRTLEDLHVRTSLLDLNNHTINVTVRWYKNNTLNLTVDYNSSYANGTTFIATLDDRNTTKNEQWWAGLTLYDGYAYFNVNSTNVTILNTLPNASLISPLNGSITLNRTNQVFTWATSDDDGDTISTQRINISLIAASLCTDSNYDGTDIYNTAGGASTFTLSIPLNCLSDNNDYYKWRVSANDSEGYGSYTPPFNFSVQAYLNTVMNISLIEFGNIASLKTNDTVDNSPKPFIIVNQGNALNDIRIHATSLWKSVANPSAYYQAKIANVTTNGISENGSFKWATSQTTYLNIPLVNSTNYITDLNYTDSTDSAEIDINVTVPSTEGAGPKTSTITFTIVLGSGDVYNVFDG